MGVGALVWLHAARYVCTVGRLGQGFGRVVHCACHSLSDGFGEQMQGWLGVVGCTVDVSKS